MRKRCPGARRFDAVVPRGPHAALARRSGARQVRQRPAAHGRGKEAYRRLGGERHAAGDLKALPRPSTKEPDWRIGKPDLVIQMPRPFKVPATGTVEYQYYLIDPGLKEDRWVKASEVRPGSRQVVHHAVVFVQPPGELSVIAKDGFGFQMLAAYGPGMRPRDLKGGLAKLVPAGSKLVFQMHYTPCGVEQTDRTQVGLVFADPKEVKKEHRSGIALNFDLRIPAGEKNHKVEANHRFSQETWLYSLAPHMHLRGKSFRFEAVYPDGSREVLLRRAAVGLRMAAHLRTGRTQANARRVRGCTAWPATTIRRPTSGTRTPNGR